VLLLPAEKTIVLLPGTGLPDSIAGPPPMAGEAGVTEMADPQYGWALGWTRPVPRAAFNSEPLPAIDSLPEIGHGLRLLAIKPSTEVGPGKVVRVLVEWLVTAPQPADVFSVVQLVKSDFSVVPGGGDHHVLFYVYPSAMWQPGDIIPDWHEFTISTALPDGVYRWGAGAYVPPSGERLPVTPPDGYYGPQLNDLWLWDSVRFPQPQLDASLPGSAIPVKATLGDGISLEGYQLQKSGQSWVVTLYWRATSRAPGDYTVFVHAERNGKLVAQRDEKPVGGQLPTWAWLPGELVTTVYTLALPPGVPGPDALYVGMYSYPSLERLPVIQDGVSLADRRVALWSAAVNTNP
jgi:hypothetical protein